MLSPVLWSAPKSQRRKLTECTPGRKQPHWTLPTLKKRHQQMTVRWILVFSPNLERTPFSAVGHPSGSICSVNGPLDPFIFMRVSPKKLFLIH